MENLEKYRGISLLSVISKCYTCVLNTRMKEWMEENEKIIESQVGFRHGYITADYIFTLSAIVVKCFSKKGGKLYVAFVDLQKTFDSVHRVSHFESLVRAGLSGTFLNALKAMYEPVISCVRVNNHNTEFFYLSVWIEAGVYTQPGTFFNVH